MKEYYDKSLVAFIVGWVIIMLLSLKLGWLDSFFFAAINADVQGIDYFALPKGFLNLMEGRSMFDTWGGEPFGPHSTWYLSHPAFIVFVASFFSFFTPWVSYAFFTVFTVAVVAYTAKVLAFYANTNEEKLKVYIILLCSFPMYWLLFTGNSHAPTILGLAFLFAAIYEFIYDEKYSINSANQKLMLGLLICFFSKPIVLIMLPLLLVLPETRVTTFKAGIIYGMVSFLFLVIPFLNPESIGLAKVFDLVMDPAFVKEKMNIYNNRFVLNEYMKDNSIHWLNLVAQSDYYMNHIEIFSLSSFVNTLFGKQVQPIFFKLPLLLSVSSSCLLFFVKDKNIRMHLALLSITAISLTFFLSYNTVWEYQFTSLFPVTALFFILRNKLVFYSEIILPILILSLFVSLPSLYFLLPKNNFDSTSMLLIRSTRVLPMLGIYVLLMYAYLKNLIFYFTNPNKISI